MFSSETLLFLLAAAAAQTQGPHLGPQPGDVYREFAVHNGADASWRVTDPAATAAGAKRYLPNPVLKFEIESLQNAVRAEALLDRWGGHLKTTAKRIRFNGNAWHTVPEIGTVPAGHQPERYYSQDNPVISVPLSELREGENTVSATCGVLDNYNWGQWGLYSLILRVYYAPDLQPHLRGSITSPVDGATLGENPRVQVAVDDASGGAVQQVDLLAWHYAYDENGDGVFLDWHGGYFQPSRGEPAELAHHVGTSRRVATAAEITWNTRWVPDQPPQSIRLVARIQDSAGTWFVTDAVGQLSLERPAASVRLYRPDEIPERFGVRVGRTASCVIQVQEQLQQAVEAGLALRTWHGWDGHHSPLQLNDHRMPISGMNHHYDFDILDVPVSALRRGENVFSVHSDTEHHMLEVLWPGPALLVRYQH